MPSTKCYVFCTTNVSRIQIWSPWDKYMREFDVELIYNSVCIYLFMSEKLIELKSKKV